MSAQKAVYARLLAFGGLTALVADRIYPQVMAQGVAYPAVSFLGVSELRERAFGATPGLVRARVQVDAWGSSNSSSAAVAAQILAALKDFKGTSNGVVVQWIFHEGTTDLFEDDIPVFRVSQDFEVIHEE